MDKPQKIKFRFEKDDDYRIIPVNGVWGGTTPRGDIFVELFHESLPLPKEVTHAMSPDGRLGQEIERKPADPVHRTVFVGMALTAEHAESIGIWLQQKALQVRQQRREEGAGNDERDSSTTH